MSLSVIKSCYRPRTAATFCRIYRRGNIFLYACMATCNSIDQTLQAPCRVVYLVFTRRSLCACCVTPIPQLLQPCVACDSPPCYSLPTHIPAPKPLPRLPCPLGTVFFTYPTILHETLTMNSSPVWISIALDTFSVTVYFAVEQNGLAQREYIYSLTPTHHYENYIQIITRTCQRLDMTNTRTISNDSRTTSGSVPRVRLENKAVADPQRCKYNEVR